MASPAVAHWGRCPMELARVYTSLAISRCILYPVRSGILGVNTSIYHTFSTCCCIPNYFSFSVYSIPDRREGAISAAFVCPSARLSVRLLVLELVAMYATDIYRRTDRRGHNNTCLHKIRRNIYIFIRPERAASKKTNNKKAATNKHQQSRQALTHLSTSS